MPQKNLIKKLAGSGPKLFLSKKAAG